MHPWDQVQELVEIAVDGEIDNAHHLTFISDLFRNLDPNNIEEELTEKQQDYLNILYELYANGDRETFIEWVEDNPNYLDTDPEKMI